MIKNQFIFVLIGFVCLFSSCTHYRAFHIVKNTNGINELDHESIKENNLTGLRDATFLTIFSDEEKIIMDTIQKQPIKNETSHVKEQYKTLLETSGDSSVKKTNRFHIRRIKKIGSKVAPRFIQGNLIELILGFVMALLFVLIIISALKPYPILFSFCMYSMAAIIILYLLYRLYLKFVW